MIAGRAGSTPVSEASLTNWRGQELVKKSGLVRYRLKLLLVMNKDLFGFKTHQKSFLIEVILWRGQATEL